MMKRYFEGSRLYEPYRGATIIPQATVIGNKLPLIQTIPGASTRLGLLPKVKGEQFDSLLWELGVAVRYKELGHDVEFVDEDPSARTPDMHLKGRVPETYIEMKRPEARSKYDVDERAQWHRIFEPLRRFIQDKRLEIDMEVDFHIPLEKVSDFEINEAFKKLRPWDRKVECASDRFSMIVRPLPPLRKFKEPLPIVSPLFNKVVFGIEENPCHGFTTFFNAHEASEDGLWIHALHWRACVRWQSSSFMALQRKAKGIVRWILEATQQIPDGSHGIIHIAKQEWYDDRVRELQWARILDEIDNLHHRSGIRLPYLFVNRIISRVNENGGPDMTENCVYFTESEVSKEEEVARFPKLIYAAV